MKIIYLAGILWLSTCSAMAQDYRASRNYTNTNTTFAVTNTNSGTLVWELAGIWLDDTGTNATTMSVTLTRGTATFDVGPTVTNSAGGDVRFVPDSTTYVKPNDSVIATISANSGTKTTVINEKAAQR